MKKFKKRKLNSIPLSINDKNEICRIIHALKVYDDIKKNGIKYPMVLQNGLIRRGTLRWAIAKHLDMKEIPVITEEAGKRQVLKYTELTTHAVGGYE